MNVVIAILVIAVWIAPVGLGIREAKKKNRSPHWMWFGIHPVSGWVVYFVLLSNKPLKICPNCKEKLKHNAKNCPYCEYKFESAGLVTAAVDSKGRWLKPVAIVAGAFVVFLILFFLVFQLVSGTFTSSEPYKMALGIVSENQNVQLILGKDIRQDGVISGSTSFSGSRGSAQMTIPIKGENGSGTINLEAKEEGGKWQFSVLNVEHQGVYIDMLSRQ